MPPCYHQAVNDQVENSLEALIYLVLHVLFRHHHQIIATVIAKKILLQFFGSEPK